VSGIALGLILGVVTAAGESVKPPPPSETDAGTPLHLWVDAATDIPIHVGGRVELEAWHRLRLWTSLGVLPEPYVEMIDYFGQAFGGYDDATSELIVSSLKRSLVWRLHAGWRPFKDAGFTVDLGYTLATLGGDTQTSELLGAALGRDVSSEVGTTFDLDATVHLLGVELGYRWPLPAGFSVRASLGFATTVAASTQAEPSDTNARSLGTAELLEVYLDDVFTRYVHFPYVGVGVGYDLSRLW
jgi:hypothetical protein